LSNALGDHVHQDFWIRNNFGSGFDQIRIHNLAHNDDQADGIKLRNGVGTLIAFREIAAEAPSIVHYCQNSIGYSLAFDVRLGVLDSPPL
jgi:hypothetical protein